jgi:hypothetical protein
MHITGDISLHTSVISFYSLFAFRVSLKSQMKFSSLLLYMHGALFSSGFLWDIYKYKYIYIFFILFFSSLKIIYLVIGILDIYPAWCCSLNLLEMQFGVWYEYRRNSQFLLFEIFCSFLFLLLLVSHFAKIILGSCPTSYIHCSLFSNYIFQFV